ncbi:hypothetical protein [Marixanthomonas ophiurae]|uniref:Uncharacterized protein n=1 Tax=Marixanthomonas ophiurae TaxID=387659 RepID=A0A3E1Q6M9_9FLAO|nr:hypothetical protein [Marixanthomonas ophiurae]RFN57781.1 hypothetical protein DZ858_11065 [Marixanthomonas ophiurae]
MSREALEMILGIGFAILGLALFLKRETLSKSKYYRVIMIVAAIMFVAFAVYLGFRSFNSYE